MSAVLLLSGGIDSATILTSISKKNEKVYALTFDYGQKHHAEIKKAKNLANEFHVYEHKIFKLNLSEFADSSLTDQKIQVPKSLSGDDIPSTYVPGRNTIFLSIALSYAESKGCSSIYIGANAVDYSGYPDCRPEYIEAFQNLINLATKKTVTGGKIQIFAPLINLTKIEIIELGIRNGLDIEKTLSCYDPILDNKPCNMCPSCVIRNEALTKIKKGISNEIP
jgi:7-cyano-7-deazaguanine synthase